MSVPSTAPRRGPALGPLARAVALGLLAALAAGCKPRKPPPKPAEAAYQAICDGKMDDLRKILDKRVHRNLELHDGSTLFHAAAMRGRREMVEYLLPCVSNINLTGPGALTALHLAAAKGHADLVRLFLEQGADPDSGNQDNRTPLHLASAEGRIEIARLLLDAGADIEARDGSGFTPLHWAAIKGQKEMVVLLLERNADFTAECRKGRTPLWYAGTTPAVAAILEEKREFRRVAVLCEPPAEAGTDLADAAAALEQLVMIQLQGFRGVVTYTPEETRRAWFGGTNAPARAPEPERLRALAGKLEADRILHVRLAPAGSELAADARLFDAAQGTADPLPATRVPAAAGLAGLETNLAAGIVARLDVNTSGTVARVATDDPAAFHAFGKGARLLAGDPLAAATNRALAAAAAAAAFDAAADADADFAAASLCAGRALLELRRLNPRTNVSESVSRHVAAANRAVSNHPAALLLAGRDAAARGDAAGAIQTFDRALSLNPHLAEARFERALALRSRKQLNESIDEWVRVLRLRPAQARTYAELGLTLAHNNNWANAVTQCEKAIELDPHIPEVYNTLAIAHWQMKNYEYAWKTVRLAQHFGHEDALDKKFLERLKKETPPPKEKDPRRRP